MSDDDTHMEQNVIDAPQTDQNERDTTTNEINPQQM